MDTYFINILVGLTVITCVLVVSIIVSAYAENKRRKRSNISRIQNEARTKSNLIIHNAMKRANEMLVEAELAGVQTVAQKRIEAGKFETTYEKDLEDMLTHTLKELRKASEAVEVQYQKFLGDVRKSIAVRLEENAKGIDQLAAGIKSDVRAQLSTLMKEQEKRVLAQHVQEIEITQSMLTEYQNKRKQIAEEHIVDLVEATTKLVLNKQLSLDEHAQLVLDSLEQAKKEGLLDKNNL